MTSRLVLLKGRPLFEEMSFAMVKKTVLCGEAVPLLCGGITFSSSLFFIIVRSRSLLSVDPRLDFPGRACDWFKQIFMREHLAYLELQGSNSNHVTRLHHESAHTSAKYDTVVVSLSNNQSFYNDTQHR